jgi:hypothetical protein
VIGDRLEMKAGAPRTPASSKSQSWILGWTIFGKFEEAWLIA